MFKRLEMTAWAGLLAGVVACAARAAPPAPPYAAAASFTPDDLKAWAEAAAASISAVTAALNALAILWYRVRRGRAAKDKAK